MDLSGLRRVASGLPAGVLRELTGLQEVELALLVGAALSRQLGELRRVERGELLIEKHRHEVGDGAQLEAVVVTVDEQRLLA